MQLSVFKNNRLIDQIDLSNEINTDMDGEGIFFIGRSSQCHVYLDDKKISREHAKLIHSGAKWVLENLTEINLFSVNGETRKRYELKNDDIILLNEYKINVDLPQTIKDVVVKEEIELDRSEDKNSSVPTGTMTMAIPRDFDFKDASPIEEQQKKEDQQSLNDDGTFNFDNSGTHNLEIENNNSSESFENDYGENNGFGDEFAGNEDFVDGQENVEFSEEQDGLEMIESPDDVFSDDQNQEGFDLVDADKTNVMSGLVNFELEIYGEFSPYDRYVIDKETIIIGRDSSKADLVIHDPDISAVHAKIIKTNVICMIEDLNSHNGTTLNGKKINKDILKVGDEIVLGSTTFTVRVQSEILDLREDQLMPVEKNQVVQVEEIIEVDEDDEIDDKSSGKAKGSFIERMKNNPEERKKLLFGAVILLALLLFLPDEKKEEPKVVKTPKVERPKEESKWTQEVKAELDTLYELAKRGIEANNLLEAQRNLDEMKKYDPKLEYKNARDLDSQIEDALALLAKKERDRERDKLEIEKKARIKELEKKAEEAVAKKQSTLSRELFSKILEEDPENLQVVILRKELEDWERKENEKKVEEATRIAERKRKVDLFIPVEKTYLKKNWYQAAIELEKFTEIKDMDEDLLIKANKYLEQSKKELENIVNPRLGKARSLIEGQDLKGAYEIFKEILNYEPTNVQAITEMSEIRSKLHNRSKKVYRQALISESLSLFNDAKEKFQEVQQISPSDSEYYKKATLKLKNYLE